MGFSKVKVRSLYFEDGAVIIGASVLLVSEGKMSSREEFPEAICSL